jgi:hypothetical protein
VGHNQRCALRASYDLKTLATFDLKPTAACRPQTTERRQQIEDNGQMSQDTDVHSSPLIENQWEIVFQ